MEDHIQFDADGCALLLLDQRKLPLVEETFFCRTVQDVIYALQTMVVDKPVRSGQQVYAKGRDLVVLAPVGQGAEVIADGNIHIYAPLRGRALAGVMGFEGARIFCKELRAELISVAGLYRVSEDLPENLHGVSAQIRLSADWLVVQCLMVRISLGNFRHHTRIRITNRILDV